MIAKVLFGIGILIIILIVVLVSLKKPKQHTILINSSGEESFFNKIKDACCTRGR